jgi:hypothetical protein
MRPALRDQRLGGFNRITLFAFKNHRPSLAPALRQAKACDFVRP